MDELQDDAEEQLADVALQPAANADASESVSKCIAADILARYDVFSYRHAASILADSFSSELNEVQEALRAFSLTCREMQMPGGNESEVPKKFSKQLRGKAWIETRVQADLLIRLEEYDQVEKVGGKLEKHQRVAPEPKVIKNFIDGHKIDYVKGRVAFDLEWNSKDQTFDRDLYALRAFHECGIISAGILVTRSASLNPLFDLLPLLKKDGSIALKDDGSEKTCKQKYGASTTWMGKLLYRLNAGRHGGCPVLVFGIRPDAVSDWKTHERNPERREH